jgi:NTE family protein
MVASYESSEQVLKTLAVVEAMRSDVRERYRDHLWLHSGNDTFLLVHLVLQGGGTLGVAHLGFLKGLEHAGIRFAGLAGTSAGAIVALLMVAARGGSVRPAVASTLLPILQAIPAATFMDGPYRARRLVKQVLGGRVGGLLDLALPAWSSVKRLVSRFGLHRGERFEDWMAHTMSTLGVRDISALDLILQRSWLEVVTAAGGSDGADDNGLWQKSLQVAATAMPIGLKIVFPEDYWLLAEKYRLQSPALIARTSMSVPFFFEPKVVDLDSRAWQLFVEKRIKPHYSEAFIKTAEKLDALSFVDGGLLSNFPIDAFAEVAWKNKCLRDIPTIGVALVPEKAAKPSSRMGSLKNFAGYCGSMLEAMRHLRDRETLERAVDKGTGGAIHVHFVNTGKHNWLNFALSEEDMRDLYLRGLEASVEFLRKFVKKGDSYGCR